MFLGIFLGTPPKNSLEKVFSKFKFRDFLKFSQKTLNPSRFLVYFYIKNLLFLFFGISQKAYYKQAFLHYVIFYFKTEIFDNNLAEIFVYFAILLYQFQHSLIYYIFLQQFDKTINIPYSLEILILLLFLLQTYSYQFFHSSVQ